MTKILGHIRRTILNLKSQIDRLEKDLFKALKLVHQVTQKVYRFHKSS